MSASTAHVAERARYGPALLVLAPALVLALPPVLAMDPLPHASAAGWALLASIPCAVWLARGAVLCVPPGLALLALPAAAALVAWASGRANDGFELGRALCHAAVALVALLGGAALSPGGRAALVRALLALSLLFLLPALFPIGLVPNLAGALGNTGALSQAAIPGVAAFAWLLVAGPGRAKGAAVGAIFIFSIHAAFAPVLTGSLALAGALGIAALASVRTTRLGSVALVGLALFSLYLPFAIARARAESAEAVPRSPAAATSATSGLGVRLRLAATLPAVLAAESAAGLGPGQFQASYPPYRDPAEIERSTHGRALDTTSEVEHLHDDWLQGLAEWGLVGGLAWIAFLALVGRAAWRGLRRADADVGALALAALALLANAVGHAPLTYNAAAAVQAFACFGAVLSAAATPLELGGRAGGIGRLSLALLVALALWPAQSLVRHGRALAERNRIVAELAEKVSDPDLADDRRAALGAEAEVHERAALEAALAAAPSSATAHGLLARSLATHLEERERAIEEWTRVLELRPHSVEARLERGRLLALGGRFEEARADVAHALELDPESPTAIRNAALVEIQDGHAERAAPRFDQLAAQGRLDPAWLGQVLGYELRHLAYEQALELAGRLDERARSGNTYEISLLGDEAEVRGEHALAAAYACLAHWRWGREHAAARNWDTAARSYRQADQAMRRARDLPSPHLRLELAAAEAVAGNVERAREALAPFGEGKVDERAISAAPAWAPAALREVGLLPPP